ncbi:DUF6241 domain-containing protein [Priestia endophytica]|uniref:DUF6241 domain-containing protein n=1 Tax=Priestia endophytica TaxID=135735 RepID=UPI002281B9BE|nr:DUF6241 domain-containing protein [Priestia endophytica]MCY8235565.1 DUF6241 domain-containing protein [Priestia endophytica]
MKKFFKITGIALVMCLAIAFITFKVLDKTQSQELQKEEEISSEVEKEQKADELKLNSEETVKGKTTDSSSKEAFERAETSEGHMTFEPPENPTEADIMHIMHLMTHQKVRANKKEGAIRMTPYSLAQVTDLINEVQPPNKKKLLQIVNHWENGNFDNVIEEHNYFWEYEGGKVGKAIGRMTMTEESYFVRKHFYNDDK